MTVVLDDKKKQTKKQIKHSKKSQKPLKQKEAYLTIGDHLEELRWRLIFIFAIILILSIVCFIFGKTIHNFLIQPYLELTAHKLLLHNVYGSLEVLLKLSFMLGFTFGLPICLSLLWGFVTPAIKNKHAWWGHCTVAASSLLFWSGLWLAWQYLFPLSLQFLFQSMLLEGVAPQTTVEKYYSFLFLLHIGCGLVFQLPLLIIILGWLNILSMAWHRKNWKYIALITLVLAAVITPPDPLSQLVLAGLMCALYATAVFIVWLIERMRRKQERKYEKEYEREWDAK